MPMVTESQPVRPKRKHPRMRRRSDLVALKFIFLDHKGFAGGAEEEGDFSLPDIGLRFDHDGGSQFAGAGDGLGDVLDADERDPMGTDVSYGKLVDADEEPVLIAEDNVFAVVPGKGFFLLVIEDAGIELGHRGGLAGPEFVPEPVVVRDNFGWRRIARSGLEEDEVGAEGIADEGHTAAIGDISGWPENGTTGLGESPGVGVDVFGGDGG